MPHQLSKIEELVLHGLLRKECLIYLDDVLVFSRSFTDHLQSLGEVFSQFHSAGLKLKARKCQLAQTQATFMGHVVSSHGIRLNARNLNKVHR